jgi:hypothetical protein
LFGIGDGDPKVGAISEKLLELRKITGSGNYKNVLNTCQHEDRQGIVNHWFVVDRDQLFGENTGQGIKPGAGTASEDNAFHGESLVEESCCF